MLAAAFRNMENDTGNGKKDFRNAVKGTIDLERDTRSRKKGAGNTGENIGDMGEDIKTATR